MPLWGQIRRVSKGALDDEPLAVLDGSRSQSAEAIRKLRGSFEFANVDQPVQSLFIASALQYEGKSVHGV